MGPARVNPLRNPLRLVEWALRMALLLAISGWLWREWELRRLTRLAPPPAGAPVPAEAPEPAPPRPTPPTAPSPPNAAPMTARAAPMPALTNQPVRIVQAPPDDFIERLNNPKRKDYIKASFISAMDGTYAPLFRYYRMTAEQIAYLKYLLAEKQAFENDSRARIFKSPPAARAELEAELNAQLAARAQTIRDYLGAQAFEIYLGYDESLSEQLLTRDIRRTLANLQLDLTYAQEDALIRILYEERMNAFEIRDLLAAPHLAAVPPEAARTPPETIRRSHNAMEQRVVSRCRALLNAAQLEFLTNHLAAARARAEMRAIQAAALTDSARATYLIEGAR